MKYAFLILLAVNQLFLSCKDKSETKDSVQTVTIQDLTIEEEEVEPPPPSSTIDLAAFNIMVLKPDVVYYYYDPGYVPDSSFERYKYSNLNKAYLHKSDFPALKKIVDSLGKKGYLQQKSIWLSIEGNDEQLSKRIFTDILVPAGFKEATVGFIPGELYTLLKTTR